MGFVDKPIREGLVVYFPELLDSLHGLVLHGNRKPNCDRDYSRARFDRQRGLIRSAIGIVNTMVMSIYERTREIGILKALGASRSDVRRLFMIEAGLIGFAGGVVGFVSGWGIGLVLNQGVIWYLKSRELPTADSFFVITPVLAAGVVLFAVGIGVLAELLPAQRAATLDPVTALRHE